MRFPSKMQPRKFWLLYQGSSSPQPSRQRKCSGTWLGTPWQCFSQALQALLGLSLSDLPTLDLHNLLDTAFLSVRPAPTWSPGPGQQRSYPPEASSSSSETAERRLLRPVAPASLWRMLPADFLWVSALASCTHHFRDSPFSLRFPHLILWCLSTLFGVV